MQTGGHRQEEAVFVSKICLDNITCQRGLFLLSGSTIQNWSGEWGKQAVGWGRGRGGAH